MICGALQGNYRAQFKPVAGITSEKGWCSLAARDGTVGAPHHRSKHSFPVQSGVSV